MTHAGSGRPWRNSPKPRIRLIGAASVSARRRSGAVATTKYRASSASGRVLFGWIDAAYKFPLQIRTEDGVIVTAENVRDAPQPAILFEIPAGFRKFDPRILIQQIKQSDVWVAGQKDLDRAHP